MEAAKFDKPTWHSFAIEKRQVSQGKNFAFKL